MSLLLQRIYGGRWNPAYQSGVLAVLLLGLALASGLILLLFYRVDDPYGSVAAMQAAPLLRALRAFHRYTSDAAVLAVLAHVIKMGWSGRAFGPRARAWVSGIVLTGLMLVIGVTGLMMIWDTAAQRLALASVRVVELLPIFSEPPRRIFASGETLGSAFFFMLMFLHVALPLGFAFLLWLHTSRLARAVYLPERKLCGFWALVLLLIALAWPAPLNPPADLSRLPGPAALDLWYTFWLPLEEWAGGALTVGVLGLGAGLLAVVPWTRKEENAPKPSFVDEKLCDGCTQCFQDCPYDAISMVARSFHDDGRHSDLVARVDPELCVSCGICAGSCKPMGVGPPERTGRDQLKAMETMLKLKPLADGEVVALACSRGCGLSPRFREQAGVRLVPTPCSGSVHTSVMELFLRRGAAGVMVISCPERDCAHREGPKWLEQRVYHDREAELMARVDRRRIRLAQASRSEAALAASQAAAFHAELHSLPATLLEEEEKICAPPPVV